MANKILKNAAKTTAIAAAAVGGASLLISEIAFEVTLTKRGAAKRQHTIYTEPAEREYLRRHPEELTDNRQWYDCTPHEDKFLVSSHGENLYADYLKSEAGSHHYAICVHGWTSCPKNIGTAIRHYYEMGWNVLVPHMRAHGKSEEKVVGMAWYDKFDILDWITYLVTTDPEAEILLIGVSMGGATVASVSGETLPENVKVIVSDCSFTSAWAQFENTCHTMLHLPTHPVMDTVRLLVKIRAGYDIKAVAPIEQVKKSVTPIFFAHGEKDSFIPISMMHELYAAAACDKEMLAVPDADHADSWNVHPELYWPAVDAFTAKYMSLEA